jgi:hypothetical protein
VTAAKVVASHLVLYSVTYAVLDAVEDGWTASGDVALAILGLTVPLSFAANLWALGDLAETRLRRALLAAALTALVSPLSVMLWLWLYVEVVGYESRVSGSLEGLPRSRHRTWG